MKRWPYPRWRRPRKRRKRISDYFEGIRPGLRTLFAYFLGVSPTTVNNWKRKGWIDGSLESMRRFALYHLFRKLILSPKTADREALAWLSRLVTRRKRVVSRIPLTWPNALSVVTGLSEEEIMRRAARGEVDLEDANSIRGFVYAVLKEFYEGRAARRHYGPRRLEEIRRKRKGGEDG